MMATAELIEATPDSEVELGASQEHSRYVAHHFDSAQQQFDACKLGMWLFLVTEVLFFSGLFVAYAVYRANHPEVFVNAHKYLNTTLGAFNTIVLLVSSLTMAWAVRSAQLEQKRLLVWMLGITLSCASLFLGVKVVEYSHKWGKGLLWASAYEVTAKAGPSVEQVLAHTHQALTVLSVPGATVLALSAIACVLTYWGKRANALALSTWIFASSLAFFGGVGLGQVVEHFSHASHPNESHVVDGLASENRLVNEGHGDSVSSTEERSEEKKITGVFFSIYYVMTGVHAVHILCGMGVIAWLLWRAIRQEFNRQTFGPVDFVGLYWHLVDLVWIYLFPLLYLIR